MFQLHWDVNLIKMTWNILLKRFIKFSSGQHLIFLFFISLHVCMFCFCHILINFCNLEKENWISSIATPILVIVSGLNIFSYLICCLTFPDAIVAPPPLSVNCCPSLRVICLFILKLMFASSPGINISFPSKTKNQSWDHLLGGP